MSDDAKPFSRSEIEAWYPWKGDNEYPRLLATIDALEAAEKQLGDVTANALGAHGEAASLALRLESSEAARIRLRDILRAEIAMPHLMNCTHAESGWCSECVKAMGEENQHYRLERMHVAPPGWLSPEDVAKVRAILWVLTPPEADAPIHDAIRKALALLEPKP